MPLGPAVVLALASQCAPSVAPETLLSVVRVESGLEPLVIGVNRPAPDRVHPTSLSEAVAIATRLIETGANIDLGLGQINSANLVSLGLTVADAFEPCHNLQAAGAVLLQAYQSQGPVPGREQIALRTALSIYTTGRSDRGFRNGYVAKVSAAMRVIVPPLEAKSPQPITAPPPAWNVFAKAGSGVRIEFTAIEGDHP
jgi:type IV secretion system protein VirB1